MAKRRTQQDILDLIKNEFNDEYELLSTFTGTSYPITLKHKICGDTWSPLANNFIRKQSKCPLCSGKKPLTNEVFQKMLDDNTDSKFELVGDFKGHSSKKYTKLKHRECGYEFEVTGGHFNWAKPIGCRECSNMLIHTTERVKELLIGFENGDYELISESENNRTPIEVKHRTCGETYETTSGNLINNNDICPKCFVRKGRVSSGESRIVYYLKSMSAIFKTEKTIEGCKHINHLLFDFIIYDSDSNILLAIEFDGEQHFKPIEFWGGEEGFKLTQLRDTIKNSFCNEESIPLLRIPYWEEENIPQILEYELNRLFEKKVA